MLMKRGTVVAVFILLLCLVTDGYTQKTQILVLGTVHLSTMGEEFEPSYIDPLVDVLKGFKPDLVCIESLPFFEISYMKSNRESYGEVVDAFAKDNIEYGEKMQDKLGIPADIARLMADSIINLMETSSENMKVNSLREKLITYLIASYDIPSAVLQWKYIKENGRNPTESEVVELIPFLDGELESNNEIYSIAVKLAYEQGLQRVYSIDSHTDKDIFLQIAGQLTEELQGLDIFKSIAGAEIFVKLDEMTKNGIKSKNLLPLYEYINSPEYVKEDVAVQWDIFLKTNLPSGLDRTRLALWEVRNLNIASHIRKASALHPGQKVLVIIGASHKYFLDTYLSEMRDVEVLQLLDIEN